MRASISRECAGLFTQITDFLALVLCKADQMSRTRRAVFTFCTNTSKTGHPVALAAFIADGRFNQ